MKQDTYIPKPGQELTGFERWQMKTNGEVVRLRHSFNERCEEDEDAERLENYMHVEAEKQLENHE